MVFATNVDEAGTSAEDSRDAQGPGDENPRNGSQDSSKRDGSEPQLAGLSQLSDLSQLDTLSPLDAGGNGAEGKADGSHNLSLSQLNTMPPFDALSQERLETDIDLPSQPDIPPPQVPEQAPPQPSLCVIKEECRPAAPNSGASSHDIIVMKKKTEAMRRQLLANIMKAPSMVPQVFENPSASRRETTPPRSHPKSKATRRGPMDDMRQIVRIMVKVIPQSFKFVSASAEGGGNNRISEAQIRMYLQKTLGPEAPYPDWGVPEGWGAYLARLLSWASGRNITREQAEGCARRDPGRSWEAIPLELEKLGVIPEAWELPLDLAKQEELWKPHKLNDYVHGRSAKRSSADRELAETQGVAKRQAVGKSGLEADLFLLNECGLVKLWESARQILTTAKEKEGQGLVPPSAEDAEKIRSERQQCWKLLNDSWASLPILPISADLQVQPSPQRMLAQLSPERVPAQPSPQRVLVQPSPEGVLAQPPLQGVLAQLSHQGVLVQSSPPRVPLQPSPQDKEVWDMQFRGFEPVTGFRLYAQTPMKPQGSGLRSTAARPYRHLQWQPQGALANSGAGGDPVGSLGGGSAHLGLPPLFDTNSLGLSQPQGFSSLGMSSMQGTGGLQLSLGSAFGSQPDTFHSPVKFGGEPPLSMLPPFQSPTKCSVPLMCGSPDPFQSPPPASPSPPSRTAAAGTEEPTSFERHPGLRRRPLEDGGLPHPSATSHNSLVHTKIALFNDPHSPSTLPAVAKDRSQSRTLIGRGLKA